MKHDKMGGSCGTWVRREMHTEFWCGNLRERGHFEGSINRRIIFKWVLKQDGKLWIELIWFRTVTVVHLQV